MIVVPHQGRGFGRAAIDLLISHLRALAIPERYTSYHLGLGRPKGFYDSLVHKPTGSFYGEEPEVVLKIRSD